MTTVLGPKRTKYITFQTSTTLRSASTKTSSARTLGDHSDHEHCPTALFTKIGWPFVSRTLGDGYFGHFCCCSFLRSTKYFYVLWIPFIALFFHIVVLPYRCFFFFYIYHWYIYIYFFCVVSILRSCFLRIIFIFHFFRSLVLFYFIFMWYFLLFFLFLFWIIFRCFVCFVYSFVLGIIHSLLLFFCFSSFLFNCVPCFPTIFSCFRLNFFTVLARLPDRR